jgi:hypothetical protein
LLCATTINAQEQAQTKKPLSEKENPELIGRRDLNNIQINFYSLEKEVGLGLG